MKDVIGRYRTDADISRNAGVILKTIGLTKSSAIDIFFRQIIMTNGLPFDLRIPNKETLDAIHELDCGGGNFYNSVDELFNDLEEEECPEQSTVPLNSKKI